MLEGDLNHMTLEGISAIDSCFADVDILVEIECETKHSLNWEVELLALHNPILSTH
jgi:hypothetical protein